MDHEVKLITIINYMYLTSNDFQNQSAEGLIILSFGEDMELALVITLVIIVLTIAYWGGRIGEDPK